MTKKQPKPKSMKPIKISFALTDDQKNIITDNYDKLDLNDLIKKVWNDPDLDQRSVQGKVVKEFMIGQGVQMKVAPKKISTGPIKLDDDQKTFIETNLVNGLRAMEITKLLFQAPSLSPLSKEFRAVFAHVKTLSPDNVDYNEEVVEEKEFKPPQSLNHLIYRVNKYNPTGNADNLYSAENLKAYEEKCLKQLMSYIRSPTFIYQATQYEKKVDRELFEGNFIRFCYDKPDLTAEEIHQYISLSSEIVNTAQIERTIQRLDSNINEWLNGDDDEKKKMSMSMVELINAARGKWESSKERQKKLLSELTESRAVRQKNRMDQNASIMNLVESFMKEKDRKELIEIAEMEKRADIVETDKLMNMDQVVALIAGMGYRELTR